MNWTCSRFSPLWIFFLIFFFFFCVSSQTFLFSLSSTVSCSSGKPTMHCLWFAACLRCSSGRWVRRSCTSSLPTRRGHQAPVEVSFFYMELEKRNRDTFEHFYTDLLSLLFRCGERASCHFTQNSQHLLRNLISVKKVLASHWSAREVRVIKL